ncbi:TPA: hypothetical protein ACH3X3_012731 [Trebouxia sp. C0006]
MFHGSSSTETPYSNLHELTARDIDLKNFNFSSLVNKDFATLEEHFAGQGLTIVAFPCNQFLSQEPGSNKDIKEFARSKGFKGVLMDKIDVNGPKASPVYTFLKACFPAMALPSPPPAFCLQLTLSRSRTVAAVNLQAASGDTSPISWNFAKFLVKKDGTVFGRYGPSSTAVDLTPHIEKLLAEDK